MDDKFINALKTSEQLTEAKLDEAGFGATALQMAKNAGKAVLNNIPGAQTVKKVANGIQNAYKTAANQVDDKKNTETIKKCVDLLAKQLCKQMLAANSDEKAMKNLMPVLVKNYGIPQDVVKAAYKDVQSTNAQAEKDKSKNESVRAYRVSRMLHITEEGNNEANQVLSLLGNVYKNNFDLTALSKVWESLKTNNATKQIFADENFKKLSGAVDAMITANNQGQQKPQNPEQSQTQQQQQQPENKPDPQKSEEIAKKADEIPPKAGQQINNEYWHKVWTSLSNKAGSLNGQEELQNVVNNFVTELGRIVNK